MAVIICFFFQAEDGILDSSVTGVQTCALPIFSGGEQQMLAIGRALMGNPRVLLLDEPSEGLAPLIVAEVGRAMKRLKEEGQSIILVEQNRQLALGIADRAVILNTGRRVFDGGANELATNEALVAQHLG